jgi:hypothetical protein
MVRHDTKFIKKPFFTSEVHTAIHMKSGVLNLFVMAKAAFNKKRALFTSTLDLELRKKLVKCYVWSIA